MENTVNKSNGTPEVITIQGTPQLKVHHQAAKGVPKGSIVFVHGVCHGAWCFGNFMEYFSENGYECFALDLRGHGDNNRKDLKGADLSKYADDVKRCIDDCSKYLREKGITGKPFLLGHSMGGAVVQKYIGQHHKDIKGAILFASATAPRMCFFRTLATTLFNYRLFLASLVVYGCTKDSVIKKAAFFTGKDKNGKRVQRVHDVNIFQLLHREPLKVVFIDLHRKYTGNATIDIPVLVTGSYADLYFPEKSLNRTAKVYGCSENDTRKQLVKLDYLCHDMMLDDDWKGSANVVLKFMENNN